MGLRTLLMQSFCATDYPAGKPCTHTKTSPKTHMANPHGVDFDQVIKNAEKQGIDLAEILLFYEGLTDDEIFELKRHNLFKDQSERCIIGKFTKEGLPLFPDKVTGVYSLSA
jgi:hypothetical protein